MNRSTSPRSTIPIHRVVTLALLLAVLGTGDTLASRRGPADALVPAGARPASSTTDEPAPTATGRGPVNGTEVDTPPAPATSPPPFVPPPYRVTAYTIGTLAPDALPHAGRGVPARTLSGPQDADGIPMKLVGKERYYSPAALAQYGIRYEDAFRRLHDPAFLAIARKVEGKLMSLGVPSDDGLYLPYRYAFALHGIKGETLRAPWYSAMAQGIALSLAVRLHRDTSDPAFLADAQRLFETFRHLGRGKDPWVAYVDADRYLWLEEYPEPRVPSDHTANGFDFALFGVYDYYEETRDPVSLQVLRAGLTTMRDHIAAYRIPGSPSRYCLRHGPPELKYHRIVTSQLLTLYDISGDDTFLTEALLFASDAS